VDIGNRTLLASAQAGATQNPGKAEQIHLFYHIVDLDGRKIDGGDAHSELADLFGGQRQEGVYLLQ
jgi:hypothetical protein